MVIIVFMKRLAFLILFLNCIFLSFSQDNSKVDSLIKLLPGQSDSMRVVTFQSIANYQKNTDEMRYWKLKALKLADSIGSVHLQIQCNLVMGWFEHFCSNYSDALEYLSAAEKYAQYIGDESKLARTYRKRGDVMGDLNNHERSMYYYHKAEQIVSDSSDLGDLYNAMGTAFKEMKMVDSALIYHFKSLNIRVALNQELMIGYSYNNIGLVYKMKEDYDKAIQYLKLSLEIKNRLRDIKGMASSNINIGNILNLQKKHDEALIYLKKGIFYADSVNHLKFLLNGYDAAVTSFLSKIGNEPMEFFSKMKSIQDSISLNKAVVLAKELEEKYQLAETKKNFELEQERTSFKQAEIEKSNQYLRNQIYLALAGLGVLGILVLVLIYGSAQRKKTNTLLSNQKEKIENINRDITDSINYAKSIQDAMLPSEEELKNSLKKHFVMYRPKDIVSGDFYWIAQKKSFTIFAVGDCTGHGVPGAFMSMMGHNFLNQIVKDQGTNSPAQALTLVNDKVLSLYRSETNRNTFDGMDIALCAINWETLELEFSGAFRPLWIIRNGEVFKLKGIRRGIGSITGDAFIDSKFQLCPGDHIYLFTDGITDQFGGEYGKKLKTSGFESLLVNLSNESIDIQGQKLESFFDEWMGESTQLDDVCVLGLII